MRAPFDKTRERFGRTSAASAPRRGENRPRAIRIYPSLRQIYGLDEVVSVTSAVWLLSVVQRTPRLVL